MPGPDLRSKPRVPGRADAALVSGLRNVESAPVRIQVRLRRALSPRRPSLAGTADARARRHLHAASRPPLAGRRVRAEPASGNYAGVPRPDDRAGEGEG